MEKGFLEAHVARGNRNLLIFGLVLTIIGVGLAVGVNFVGPLIIALIGGIMLFVWLRRMVSPHAHPTFKQLARYGDPQQVAQQVNQEFTGPMGGSKTQFGQHWLAQAHPYGVYLVPWHDIAWLHIYVNQELR
ncbi:MAG: hypothetical protein DMF64_11515 [Acidobacteria bacterium]|nr:MAG: hypothetical protein DMF64_11515 [Acidobacteriota bacterium]